MQIDDAQRLNQELHEPELSEPEHDEPKNVSVSNIQDYVEYVELSEVPATIF